MAYQLRQDYHITDMLVAKNVPLQLHLQLLNCLSAVVCNVNIHKNAGSANPNLTMNTSGHLNRVDAIITILHVLIGSCEWTR